MKHSPEWLKLMKQVMPSGDEKMEQLEHSHTAGRNVCTTTLKIVFIYFWRGEGREKERERNVWLPLERPLLGTWPATQACALTGNQTGDFGSQASTQSTEPCQPGLYNHFKG